VVHIRHLEYAERAVLAAIGSGDTVRLVLSVAKVGDRFVVEVSPPDSREPWRTTEPLSATDVLKKLSTLGCHSTDITDALYEADPSWTTAHDAEVRRRRQAN
jgi:hypothetical protein